MNLRLPDMANNQQLETTGWTDVNERSTQIATGVLLGVAMRVDKGSKIDIVNNCSPISGREQLFSGENPTGTWNERYV